MANTTSRKNIYVIGAQGTGKTTLVNALEASLTPSSHVDTAGTEEALSKPYVIREVARDVLKAKKFSREDLALPSRALELQHHILEAQLHAEKAASADKESSWYLSDRSGLDPIVYAYLFAKKGAAEDMMATTTWQELEEKMKAGVVILCEAGCVWFADLEDGTRLMPTGLDDWMRLDSAFRELLKARRIDYTIIPKDLVSLAERMAIVKRAMAEQEG